MYGWLDGMDGLGIKSVLNFVHTLFSDGWMDGWGIKSVLQLAAYFVGI